MARAQWTVGLSAMTTLLAIGCATAPEEPSETTETPLVATECATVASTGSGSTCGTTPPPPPRRPAECCGVIAGVTLDIASCLMSLVGANASCTATISNMFGQCVANGVNSGVCGAPDLSSLASIAASCISSMPWNECGIVLPPQFNWPIAIASCVGSIGDAAGSLAACGLAVYQQKRLGPDSVNGQGALQTTCVEEGMWSGRITDPRRAGTADAAEGYRLCLRCCERGGGGIQNRAACAQNCACAFAPGSPDCTSPTP